MLVKFTLMALGASGWEQVTKHGQPVVVVGLPYAHEWLNEACSYRYRWDVLVD